MSTEHNTTVTSQQGFDLYKTLSQLDEIKEFSSKFNSKRSKYIFDNATIEDPFNRIDIMKRLDLKDKRATENVHQLITKFEESLDRVLVSSFAPGIFKDSTTNISGQNCQSINKETALESYRKMLQYNLDSILDNKSEKSVKTKTLEAEEATNKRLLSDRLGVPDALEGTTDHVPSGDAPIKKRKQLSREAKRFLEAAFVAKRDPNSKERQLIAEKSGLTTMQVRVWFTNKRMRSK
ncbi:hypothetical protein WICPIJ_002310 [Wickerhamomyces pijperi]|uniref:Homeobox domain-containing protein n=1 Tax=Wickerhamomyces pijperi TaxID=599730 RepID=A0A9P8QC39_WICPI|nr:hypothetical protein WICPIJ_002310 [Wickerhamomyces pijperi]